MSRTWPFTFNIVLFAGFAFVQPFMVLFYQNAGFTGTQIGLLAGLTPLITLFGTPLWTSLADTTQRHRRLKMPTRGEDVNNFRARVFYILDKMKRFHHPISTCLPIKRRSVFLPN